MDDTGDVFCGNLDLQVTSFAYNVCDTVDNFLVVIQTYNLQVLPISERDNGDVFLVVNVERTLGSISPSHSREN